MNQELKQKLDELLKEMIFASEDARRVVFSELKAAYCEHCGCETGRGTTCHCNNDD